MSTGVHGPTRARIEAKTLRTDRWWVYPVTTFVVFTAFIIYATVRAFMGSHYYSEPYLSPFYSPCLGDCVKGSSDFGRPFGWWPPYAVTATDRDGPGRHQPEISHHPGTTCGETSR